MTSHKIRLSLDSKSFEAAKCLVQLSTPKIWNGTTLTVEIGLYDNGAWITDLSNYVVSGAKQIYCSLLLAATRSGVAIIEKQAAAAITAAPVEAHWIDGSSYSAQFTFTAAQLQMDMSDASDNSKQFWLVFFGENSTSGKITFGGTTLTIVEDGTEPSLTTNVLSRAAFRVLNGELQLWNSTREAYQTIYLSGAAGKETILIGA